MRDRSFARTVTIALFVLSGLLIGVLLVKAMEGNGIQYVWGAGGIIFIVVFIVSARAYIQRGRKTAESAGAGRDGSEVGFVVDTFQDLMAKLKEKEKELERLRAFAEEKAIRMEAYNENILQSVPSGVISVDNSLTIKSINQAAEKTLGINAGDAMGKRFDEVFRDPLAGLLNEDRTVSRAEYPYITDDRRHVWLGITTSQLKNSAGEKIGLIFVFTDLTDIKTLQSQVELKQRLSQLGEMSAGISHELRNSMSVISGYAKLLSKKVEPSNKGAVDAIQSEIGVMDKIISELLAFAKPTFLNRERLVLNDVIMETVETAAGSHASIDIKINAAGPVSVHADRVLLRQALTNLFVNAVEAMPEGGSLQIDVGSHPDKAEIVIRDTGTGIPEGVVQKIFLPFYTTKQEGTGLGLALVQKIIVSHGGSIEVESKVGKGSVFRIVLPAEA
ncbi:MAG: PAS domain-containing protein [Nitrospirae bacterium]|nr:PAS domain-containing protein [Nitrospirota bacterium]